MGETGHKPRRPVSFGGSLPCLCTRKSGKLGPQHAHSPASPCSNLAQDISKLNLGKRQSSQTYEQQAPMVPSKKKKKNDQQRKRKKEIRSNYFYCNYGICLKPLPAFCVGDELQAAGEHQQQTPRLTEEYKRFRRSRAVAKHRQSLISRQRRGDLGYRDIDLSSVKNRKTIDIKRERHIMRLARLQLQSNAPLARLQRKLIGRCQLCLSPEVDTILPCGHAVYCQRCAKSHEACLKCGQIYSFHTDKPAVTVASMFDFASSPTYRI